MSVVGALDGRVALITGVGENIGLATARLLAERGAALALNDVDAAVCTRVAEQLGGRAFPADIRSGAAVQELVDRVVGDLGRVDFLVNNAGRTSIGSVFRLRSDLVNYLQAFVHECGRVNADLCSHAPIGMLQGMVAFYIYEIVGFLA